MKMKKYLITAVATFVIFIVFAIPIFAASSTFFDKASQYYNKNCKKKIEKIDKSTAVICYVFDKVHELDTDISNVEQEQANQAANIDSLQNDVASNSADIVLLKNRKSIIDAESIRGSFFTTSSTTPVPTGNKVDITCDVSCLLLVNYYVDTRNTQASPNPTGYYNFYSIFIDGVNQAVFTQTSFPVPNVAIPLALNGTFVVSPGNHTVEIYAYVNGGTLESHESGLQALAVEE